MISKKIDRQTSQRRHETMTIESYVHRSNGGAYQICFLCRRVLTEVREIHCFNETNLRERKRLERQSNDRARRTANQFEERCFPELVPLRDSFLSPSVVCPTAKRRPSSMITIVFEEVIFQRGSMAIVD